MLFIPVMLFAKFYSIYKADIFEKLENITINIFRQGFLAFILKS